MQMTQEHKLIGETMERLAALPLVARVRVTEYLRSWAVDSVMVKPAGSDPRKTRKRSAYEAAEA